MKKQLIFSLLIMAISCGKKEPSPPQPRVNTPRPEAIPPTQILWENNYKKNFKDLPLSGRVKSNTTLWSGDHWSFKTGSINKPWSLEGGSPRNESLPGQDNIIDYTQEELSVLSPSEKFDLLSGNYNYPLKNEISQKISPYALYWEGLGNGWALASILHEEPQPVSLENPQGISIPFGSSDIKAILSYYYAFGKNTPETKHLGLRCYVAEINSSNEPECFNDLNPRDFHLTLTNEVGIKNESFILDTDPFEGVWNHPIDSYEMTSSQNEENNKMKIKLKLTYIDHALENSWDKIKNTELQKKISRFYEYELTLSPEGEVIDGIWMSKDRPDFIWKSVEKGKFEGYFKILEKLLNPSE
jgi:hypothetical protein